MGRFRRAVEQQELGGNFVDKLVEPKIGEEAAPAALRDESGLITLFGTAAASRREPTGELGAAAPDRAASEARAAADRPRHGSCNGGISLFLRGSVSRLDLVHR